MPKAVLKVRGKWDWSAKPAGQPGSRARNSSTPSAALVASTHSSGPHECSRPALGASPRLGAMEQIYFLLFTVAVAGTPGPSNALLTAVGARIGVRRGLPGLLGQAT